MTPPAAAALLPLPISSFSGWPGSRKCTCGSIAPGSRCSPSPSITSSPSRGSRPPPAAMLRITPLTTRRSPSTTRPPTTIAELRISRSPATLSPERLRREKSHDCSYARSCLPLRLRCCSYNQPFTAGPKRVGVARLSRRAHNPETGGSNPPSATTSILN